MKKTAHQKLCIVGLIAGTFVLGTTSAHALQVTLLDENFDDGTNATIQSLLSSNPSSLPTGTLWSSTTGAGDVNLRLGTDTTNTYNAGNPNQRFALTSGTNYFLPATAANKYLVMGDNNGQLAGSPAAGTFGFAMPFTLANGTTDITVSFDWVFSAFELFGTNGGSTDQFKVGISGAGFNIASPLTTAATILDQSIASYGKVHGPDIVALSVASLGAADVNGQYWLSFGLFEDAATNPTTNSGVGIDNIKITANVAPVPVPAAAWLFGAALSCAGFVGRKKNAGLRA